MRWLALALAVDAALVAGDVAMGPLVGTFVLTPILLAVVVGPRVVAIGGSIAVVLAAVAGSWSDEGFDDAYAVRLLIVAAGAALAYFAAVRRCRSDLAARDLEAAAAVGGIVSVTPTAVIGMDETGVVTLFNPAAEAIFGIAAADALGCDLAELVIPPELRAAHRDGLARVRATGESRVVGKPLELDALRGDGTRFPVSLTITRMPGAGAATFAGFIRDISERRRSEIAQQLRARTAELLDTASDYHNTLAEAVRLPVPDLADWCWIDIPDPSGRILTVVDSRAGVRPAHGRPPASAEEAAERNPQGLRRLLDTGDSVLYPQVSGARLAEFAHSAEHTRQMHEHGVTSLIVVPLRAGRRLVGAMALAATDPHRAYTADDLELAQELGQRLGTAIDNARLYEERGTTAATLMASLRPPAIPDLPGWRTAAIYQPAGRTDEVGGDFYDVFATRDDWMLVIGDVVGHGPPAAALTSLARYSIRAAATLTGSGKPALEHLNDQLRQDGRLALLSAACVRLSEDEDSAYATVAIAGHPRPILIRDGEPRLVGRTSLVLGAADAIEVVEDRIEMLPGDCLVLYTDGVIDAAGESDRFGEERLLRALAGAADSPDARMGSLRAALAGFQHGVQRDDIAALAVERTRAGALDATAAGTLRVPS
jgi:PAS domain S-box-containing protein